MEQLDIPDFHFGKRVTEIRIKVQDSDESGGTYGDLSGATFTQVTTSASVQTLEVNKDECKRFIKIVQTVGGSSPVFVYGISLVGAKKYG